MDAGAAEGACLGRGSRARERWGRGEVKRGGRETWGEKGHSEAEVTAVKVWDAVAYGGKIDDEDGGVTGNSQRYTWRWSCS